MPLCESIGDGGLLLWNLFDQSIENFSNRKQPTRARSGSCETVCMRGIFQRQTVIWLNVCFESAQEKTNSKQIIYNTLLAGAKSAREWEKEGTSAGAPGQERTPHGLSLYWVVAARTVGARPPHWAEYFCALCCALFDSFAFVGSTRSQRRRLGVRRVCDKSCALRLLFVFLCIKCAWLCVCVLYVCVRLLRAATSVRSPQYTLHKSTLAKKSFLILYKLYAHTYKLRSPAHCPAIKTPKTTWYACVKHKTKKYLNVNIC